MPLLNRAQICKIYLKLQKIAERARKIYKMRRNLKPLNLTQLGKIYSPLY
ncbi:hypothetical protein CAMSH0001_0627 [Campylobacter showae RM3277]|uniref:Uncharacterized protein n=1 Tax=Campylobacter showae RM3277 TaxID=553219 RepID=C6RGH3_9BACT|nr:hypothetical protein CAMSH0001_0627 [Campylobacter showae RM3277]